MSSFGQFLNQMNNNAPEPVNIEKQRVPSTNLFMKTLENINRPQYAVANAIFQAVDKGDFDLPKNLLRGFTLEEMKSVSDTLKSVFGVPETTLGKIGIGAAGFVGDVLTDPLTYIGAGTIGKSGKLLKSGSQIEKTAKLAGTGRKALTATVPAGLKKSVIPFTTKKVPIPGSEIIADPIAKGASTFGRFLKEEVPGVKKVVDVAGKTFSTTFRPRTVDPEVWDSLITAKQMAKDIGASATLERKEKIVQLARAMKRHNWTDEMIEQTTNILETGKKPTNWLVDNLAQLNREMSRINKELGKPSFAEGAIEHITHVKSDVGENIMSGLGFSKKEFSTTSPSDVRATIVKFTADGNYYKSPRSNLLVPETLLSDTYKKKTVQSMKKSKPILRAGDEVILSLKSGNLYSNGANIGRFAKGKTIANDQNTFTKTKSLMDQLSVAYAENSGLEGVGKIGRGTIREINKGVGAPLFSHDLPKLLFIKSQRLGKVQEGAAFYDEVRKLGSEVAEPALRRGKKVFDEAGNVIMKREVAAPELAGLYFDPEVAKHIDATFDILKGDQVSEIVKAYDKVTNFWKGTATFLNLPFHSRNAVSNYFQNTLAGVRDPKYYAQAGKLQLFQRFPSVYDQHFSKIFGQISDTDKQIIQWYKEQNLAGAGWISGDIKNSIAEDIMRTRDYLKSIFKIETGKGKLAAGVDILKTPVKGFKAATKIGGQIGRGVEGNAKMAHFIAKLDEGLTPFEAGRSVKKYLFDYDDLTDVERKVFKRIFPFFTWTRKNIPLQLENMLVNPSGQSKILKLQNNVEVMTGEDSTQEILPDWLKNAMPVFVGETKDKRKLYIKLDGFLPITDLLKLDKNQAAQTMVNMLNPLLKQPLEQALNQNFYFGQKIEKFKGQKKDLLYFSVPARIEHLARLFRPFSEFEKMGLSRRKAAKGFWEFIGDIGLGGKIYDFDVRTLLRKYDFKSREEASAIKAQLNYLKRVARERNQWGKYQDDIRLLSEMYIKARRESKINRSRVRASL